MFLGSQNENKPKMAYSCNLPKLAVWHYGLKLLLYLTGDRDWRFGMVWYGLVWYVYSFFTIVIGSKNYPKMTPHTLKSAHRIKSYSQNIEMLWPPNLIDGSLQIQFRQKGGSFFDL